jgi:hypothetical protein
MRQRYIQSLPGGKETWAQWIPRVATSSLGLGEAVPPIELGAGLPGTIGSGALEGGVYGALAPKETAHTLGETAAESALGAGLGIGERFALSPIEQGIARSFPRHEGAITSAAADVAEEKIPDPARRIIPSGVEHEAQAMGPEAAAQSPLPRAILKRMLPTASDMGESAARESTSNVDSGWNAPVLQQTVDPSFKSYLQASGQAQARGGLYSQMRSGALARLRGA